MQKRVEEALAAERQKLEEEKGLNAQQLAERRAETAEGLLRTMTAKSAVTDALTAAGARSAELLFAASQDKLQFDDKGKVSNLTALVDALKKSYPDQFGVVTPTAGVDGGAGNTNPGEKLTKEKLQKMTPAEIARLDWSEVRKVLAEG